jgi:hypothetical protein
MLEEEGSAAGDSASESSSNEEEGVDFVTLLLTHGADGGGIAKATEKITKDQAKEILGNGLCGSGVGYKTLLKHIHVVRQRIGVLLSASYSGIDGMELCEDAAFPHKQGLGKKREIKLERARECIEEFETSWTALESKYAEIEVEIDVHVAAAVKAYREQVEVLERKLSGKGRARPPPEATTPPRE